MAEYVVNTAELTSHAVPTAVGLVWREDNTASGLLLGLVAVVATPVLAAFSAAWKDDMANWELKF